MNNLSDYKKYAILYVDDEERSLEYFSEAMDNKFRVFTALNAREGYEILKDHEDEIGILMTDQRMPGELGTQLLGKARKLSPRILRILVTAYTDIDAAIQAVNIGAIYKYISKPWKIPELQITLMRGMEFFMLQRQLDHFAREKLSVLHRILIADRIISLSLLVTGMQHHVNNALVAIKTFIQLTPEKLREEGVDTDHLKNPGFWKEFYSAAQESINRITDLLSDLGEASEGPAQAVFSYRDHVQLYEVVAEVKEKLKSELKKKNIQVEQHISDSLPALSVDKEKFNRIFELLLKDEIINLPEGGHIVFTTRCPDDRKYIIVEIQDNGPAFSREAVRSVFDPFFVRSGQPKEFGIYLMACYFMVYHHGGEMNVKSDPKGGNTFILKLPIHPPDTSPLDIDKAFFHDILLDGSLWDKVLSES